MHEIEWSNLRSLNGSQHNAFEALVCQLAEKETVPTGARFYRKGSPDAGVECYWVLPDGREWGWQAKYFRNAPTDSQWRQIDDSVKKALEKHPQLEKYMICLPTNLPDSRKVNQRSSKEKWEDYVEKWKQISRQHEIAITFEFWGEHQLFERLSREENRGRFYFWFSEEKFSKSWFQWQNDEAISNLGPRYTPELNVELPITEVFDGVSWSGSFANQIRLVTRELANRYNELVDRKGNPELAAFAQILDKNILARLNALEIDNVSTHDWDSIAEGISILDEEYWKIKENAENGAPSPLERTMGQIRTLSKIATSPQAIATATQAVIIVGDAGTGKSHLLGDITHRRGKDCLPTVLLLGAQFNDNTPLWAQIQQMLGLTTDKDVYLGALDAVGQLHETRTLILIDALNESGNTGAVWHNELSGFLTTIQRYSHLAVVLTIRSTYEEIVLPEGLLHNTELLTRVVHNGFSSQEYQAIKSFFSYYSIDLPSIPLLAPEFQNPLFLKLFCKGLNNAGLHQIPPGFKGITRVFDFYIESVATKLISDRILLPHHKTTVRKAVDRLTKVLADRGTYSINACEAETIVDEGAPVPLFSHLLNENVLYRDIRFSYESDDREEVVRFSYERFSDHLIASFLLETHLDTSNPSALFSTDGAFSNFVTVNKYGYESLLYRYLGVVEALAIQIPQLTDMELFEIAPHWVHFEGFVVAYVKSLLWRNITDANRHLDFINNHVNTNYQARELFQETLIALSPLVEHAFNADFLHNNLIQRSMANRDASWSIFIHEHYFEDGISEISGTAYRLIDWSRDLPTARKNNLDDETLRLICICLAWFLTNSNRFIRDKTTKALVNLLENRLDIVRKLLIAFHEVDDLYIRERLYAVAYGVVLRSVEATRDDCINLADEVFNLIFSGNTPPPHILLRDYARGVIEATSYRWEESSLPFDAKIVRPPYCSPWPESFLSEQEINQLYRANREERIEKDRGRSLIVFSVMDWDFARYIIGTDHSSQWTSIRLDQPLPVTSRMMYNNFVDSLTDRQLAAWLNLQTTLKNQQSLIWQIELDDYLRDSSTIEEASNKLVTKIEIAIRSAEERFIKTLGKRKYEIYIDRIVPFLANPNSMQKPRDEFPFDMSLAQSWILQRVFRLGWTTDRFGSFDSYINRFSMREERKAERIGKKYQWIAYHEFLAMLSDNFRLTSTESREFIEFDGLWQLTYRTRDIDPSCLIETPKSESSWHPHSPTWWAPVQFDNWDEEMGDRAWVAYEHTLPDLAQLAEVKHPENNETWLNLEAFYNWESFDTLSSEERVYPYRSLWYRIRAFIVDSSDLPEIYEWGSQQQFWGNWMPEPPRRYDDILLGEFYWSPYYEYLNTPYFGHSGWIEASDRVPYRLMLTSESYAYETGYDCSVTDNIFLEMPSYPLFRDIGLMWAGSGADFKNSSGEIVIFDPSAHEVGPGGLLVRKDVFLEYLERGQLSVVWMLLGEKRVIEPFSTRNWPGRAIISGFYQLSETGTIEGKSTVTVETSDET